MKIIFHPVRLIDPDAEHRDVQPRCPECGSGNIFFAKRLRRIIIQDGVNVHVTRHPVDSGICRDCWHTDYDDNFYPNTFPHFLN